EISENAQKRIAAGWKKQKFHLRSTLTIQEIAAEVNPQMIGIIRYYGKYRKWALQKLMRRFHYRLAKWVLKKYKGLKGSLPKAYKWINEIKVGFPNMFYLWQIFNSI